MHAHSSERSIKNYILYIYMLIIVKGRKENDQADLLNTKECLMRMVLGFDSEFFFMNKTNLQGHIKFLSAHLSAIMMETEKLIR